MACNPEATPSDGAAWGVAHGIAGPVAARVGASCGAAVGDVAVQVPGGLDVVEDDPGRGGCCRDAGQDDPGQGGCCRDVGQDDPGQGGCCRDAGWGDPGQGGSLPVVRCGLACRCRDAFVIPSVQELPRPQSVWPLLNFFVA